MTLERAELLLDLGRATEAGALAAAACADDPSDVAAWVVLARAHLAGGDAAAALPALDEAVRLAPDAFIVLYTRGYALGAVDRDAEAEDSLRAAIRADPTEAAAYAILARLLRVQPGRGREAFDLACEAVNRNPELPEAHMAVCLTAAALGDDPTCERALHETLRLDPSHAEAQTIVTLAKAEGSYAGRATGVIADALAANPQLDRLRPQLDHATYRLVRGWRILAVISLLLAALVIDLFPTSDDPILAPLPIPLPSRLWGLFLMSLLWGFGAFLRWRLLRAGVRLNVRSMLRRGLWSRIVAAQAGLLMLGALIIAVPPWTDRTIPTAVFWICLLPAATTFFDRRFKG